MSYESPIKIITQEMKTIFEEDVVTAIQRYGIDVDKQELERALFYDRMQYERGYADAKAEIVRCKDCKHWGKHDDTEVPGETDHVKACEYAFWMVGENGYCVYGEWREEMDGVNAE